MSALRNRQPPEANTAVADGRCPESQRLRAPGLEVLVAGGLELADPPAQIHRLTDPAAAIKTLHWGRNYLYVAELTTAAGEELVVVKQFRHQSLKAKLRRRMRGSKAERSWRVAAGMLRHGLPTPEPLLLIDSTNLSGPSYYVCRYLPEVLEARYLLRAMNAGQEAELFPEIDAGGFLAALGSLLRRFHDAGFWHRDMTSGNVLIDSTSGEGLRLWLVDLNRARMGRRLSVRERMADLGRLPILRRIHQERLLLSYGGGEPSSVVSLPAYWLHHHGFLLKNRSKKGVRSGLRRARDLVLPRRAPHPHIPQVTGGGSLRDRIVWDPLSDQPHQHAGRLAKLAVRLSDGAGHVGGGVVVAAALPRVLRRYRSLRRGLYSHPTPWDGLGVCVRPWSPDPEALVAALEELGVAKVLLRLHPWQSVHDDEEELAGELSRRGFELAFALPQLRELVKDAARWKAAVEELGERFMPYGRHFQIGQAINRSKWGIWTPDEYVTLFTSAAECLRRTDSQVQVMGPAVIDFEFHATALMLNLKEPGLHFDIVASLLYVDRRGAPENRQLGLDTVGKVTLLRALAETSRNAPKARSWITECNWPLREGPHAPAGRDVAVGEEEQANYLVRYYLLALGSGMVERVYWWQAIAKGYGLIDPSPRNRLRRRPSFRALVQLQTLVGASCLGPLPSEPGAYLYAFRWPDGRQVVVGWSNGEGGIRVRLPGAVVAASGRDGERLEPPPGGEVLLTSAPIYCELESETELAQSPALSAIGG